MLAVTGIGGLIIIFGLAGWLVVLLIKQGYKEYLESLPPEIITLENVKVWNDLSVPLGSEVEIAFLEIKKIRPGVRETITVPARGPGVIMTKGKYVDVEMYYRDVPESFYKESYGTYTASEGVYVMNVLREGSAE